MMDAPRMRSVLASKWISHLQATKHRESSSERSRCSVQSALSSCQCFSALCADHFPNRLELLLRTVLALPNLSSGETRAHAGWGVSTRSTSERARNPVTVVSLTLRGSGWPPGSAGQCQHSGR